MAVKVRNIKSTVSHRKQDREESFSVGERLDSSDITGLIDEIWRSTSGGSAVINDTNTSSFRDDQELRVENISITIFPFRVGEKISDVDHQLSIRKFSEEIHG